MARVIGDTRDMLQDRIFLKKAVMIALPVALQGMLNTIVNLVDTMMIGQLGETTIAAVGLANKVFFVFPCWYSEWQADPAYWRRSTGGITMRRISVR